MPTHTPKHSVPRRNATITGLERPRRLRHLPLKKNAPRGGATIRPKKPEIARQAKSNNPEQGRQREKEREKEGRDKNNNKETGTQWGVKQNMPDGKGGRKRSGYEQMSRSRQRCHSTTRSRVKANSRRSIELPRSSSSSSGPSAEGSPTRWEFPAIRVNDSPNWCRRFARSFGLGKIDVMAGALTLSGL